MLMSTIGQKMEKVARGDASAMAHCFRAIEAVSRDEEREPRLRFMAKDMLELRGRSWVPRRRDHLASERARSVARGGGGGAVPGPTVRAEAAAAAAAAAATAAAKSSVALRAAGAHGVVVAADACSPPPEPLDESWAWAGGALRGPGPGLCQLGNTCYINALLQCLAVVSGLAMVRAACHVQPHELMVTMEMICACVHARRVWLLARTCSGRRAAVRAAAAGVATASRVGSRPSLRGSSSPAAPRLLRRTSRACCRPSRRRSSTGARRTRTSFSRRCGAAFSVDPLFCADRGAQHPQRPAPLTRHDVLTFAAPRGGGERGAAGRARARAAGQAGAGDSYPPHF